MNSTETAFLPYLHIYPFEEIPEFIDKYVYVYDYFKDGFSVLIDRDVKNDGIIFKFGDFNGDLYDNLFVENNKHMADVVPRAVMLMKLIKLSKAQFYFDFNCNLVDIRLSLNKFMSPGMLKDIFSKQLSVLPSLDIFHLTKEKFKDICDGKYKRNIIIKNSTFKTIVRDDAFYPLYGVFK